METNYTEEQKHELCAKLSAPFPPEQLKWRLQSKTKDGKKGRFVAFCDIRGYTDRLNSIFTAAGWSKTIQIQSFSAMHPKLGAASRLIFILKLNIFGLAVHESSIEGWAHEENIATRCEAQAFKRACAEAGLGRYIYDIKMSDWVDINAYGEPARPLPAPRATVAPMSSKQSNEATKPAISDAVVSNPAQATRAQATVVTMQSKTVDSELQAFTSELGPNLYQDAMAILRTKLNPDWSRAESVQFAVTELNKIKEGMTEVRRIADSCSHIWESVLDMYQVEDMQSFHSVEQFREFYVALQQAVQYRSKAA